MSGAGMERIPFEVDVNRVIEVLAKQIYQTPLALLRENAQNAFDAILLRRHGGQIFDPRITVSISDSEIAIADNGIGMTPEDLRRHYWHAGSSGKNNPQARAAGVVGTFGIGAMANFGIANALELETESAVTGQRTRSAAQRDALSATEECIEIEPIPATGEPGTLVRALMAPGAVNVQEASTYIADFVKLVEIPVLVNGTLVSQQGLESQVPPPGEAQNIDAGTLEGRLTGHVRMRVTGAGEVWVHLAGLAFDGEPVPGEIALRQGANVINTFRSGFGLAVASVNSFYNLGGAANVKIFEPTAGREALTTASMQLLQDTVTQVDRLVSLALAGRPEVNQSTAFMRWAIARDRLELCGALKARVEPGRQSVSLEDLKTRGEQGPVSYFAGSDATTITAIASEDSPLVVLASANPRRQLERAYLERFCNASEISDAPMVLAEKPLRDWSVAEQAVAFRVSTVLAGDYFLAVTVQLGQISHGIPALVSCREPVTLVLDPEGSTFGVIAELYASDYTMFGSMVKDFVRNVIFPRVSDLVPSSTREGAEAFLKSIRRTRDVFEYESDDLESLWGKVLQGTLTMDEAATRSLGVARQRVQVFEQEATRRVADVVPDLSAGQDGEESTETGPAPPMLRTEIETEAKLLIVGEDEPAIQGYRCFIALSDRAMEERGEFFLQPHSTSVVWGGQKVLFVFEHHSGQFGLYYDLQAAHVVAGESGGGPYATATIVLRNKVFLPVPQDLAGVFIPSAGERKRFEVRSDLLFTDSDRTDTQQTHHA
jgi:molecular chaperone HtpG